MPSNIYDMVCTKCGKNIKVYCGEVPKPSDPILKDAKEGKVVLFVSTEKLKDEKEFNELLEGVKKMAMCAPCRDSTCNFDPDSMGLSAKIMFIFAIIGAGLYFSKIEKTIGMVVMGMFGILAIILEVLRRMHLAKCKKH